MSKLVSKTLWRHRFHEIWSKKQKGFGSMTDKESAQFNRTGKSGADDACAYEMKFLYCLKIMTGKFHLKSRTRKTSDTSKSTRQRKQRSAGVTNQKSVMKELSGILDKRISEYRDALKQADLGLQHNPGPWLVAKGVSRMLFYLMLGPIRFQQF